MSHSGSVPAIMRTAHQFLFYRDQELEARAAKERAIAVLGDRKRNLLKEYIDANGTPNGKDFDWYFPDPLTIGENSYDGLRMQAKETIALDTDAALALLEAKGLTDRVAHEVTTVEYDWEELYELLQEGELTQEEIDGLMVTDTQYALVVIK